MSCAVDARNRKSSFELGASSIVASLHRGAAALKVAAHQLYDH
jgi:hypothetical protein